MHDCVYDFKLEEDRNKFVNREPCKLLRQVYVTLIEKKWGNCGDWKTGENCGCTYKCKRKKNIEEAKKKSKPVRFGENTR